MGAVALWVRSILRRRRGATVALAVLAGLSAGIVGASLQAARRADGAVERHAARSRAYDVFVRACPPEVKDPLLLSEAETLGQCVSNSAAKRLATEVLALMPEVEAWTTVGTHFVGVLDDSAKSGWGRGVLVQDIGSPDSVGAVNRQILVHGRLYAVNAPDEVVIGERAARVGGIQVGDVIRLASWRQDSRDAATATGIAPRTTPFECRVVGIVRTAKDVQNSSGGDLSGLYLPEALYAGPAWVAAHAGDLATYGFAVAVRLRDGPTSAGAFGHSLEKASRGWLIDEPETVTDVDVPALERGVEADRQAVLIFALIALGAGMVLVGLTLASQLRRELTDGQVLSALGLTRQGLMAGATVRAVVAGALGAAVAVVTVVTTSPLGPVGIARHLEYSHPVRLDWPVLAVVALAIPVYFAAVAVVVVALAHRWEPRPARPGVAAQTVPVGPVSRVALNFARGNFPRLATGVGAVAIAVAVAAGVLIASFDRVIDHPIRYGAWWDVAVGQYSDAGELESGVDRLTANPMVAGAAGFLEDPKTAVLNGVTVPFVALDPVVGRPPIAAMASGQAPATADEVALGAATARRLHKGIGDTITVTVSAGRHSNFSETVHVTGIAVLNNPVRPASNAGEGVLVSPDLARRLSGGKLVAQSVVIRFAPAADRQAAGDSVVSDFGGSTRPASPPADLRSLERLRFVPWLMAALVGVLALASLVYALVTLLQRHASDLAVLAALGMTKRQLRAVGPGVGIVLIAGSVVIGVPAGLVLGRGIWRVVGRRVFVPSGPVLAWVPMVIAPLVALAVAVGLAALAARSVTHRTPGKQLRTE